MARAAVVRTPPSGTDSSDPWEGTELDIYRSNFVSLTRRIRALLAQEDLLLTDLKGLHYLKSGTTRPTALAAALDLTPAAATQILDRFERKGLARRTPDPLDRRATIVRLTPEGTRQHDRASKLVREFVVALASGMSRDGLEALRRGSEELGRVLALVSAQE